MNNSDLKKNALYIAIMAVGIVILCFVGYYVLKPKNAGQGKSNTNVATQDPAFGQNDSGQRGAGTIGGAQRQGRGNFARVTGTVVAINGQTIQVHADDGSTKNVDASGVSRIMKGTNGANNQITLSEINTGDKITIIIDSTTTDPIQAQMIIIGDFVRPQDGGSGGNWQPQRQDYNNDSNNLNVNNS